MFDCSSFYQSCYFSRERVCFSIIGECLIVFLLCLKENKAYFVILDRGKIYFEGKRLCGNIFHFAGLEI